MSSAYAITIILLTVCAILLTCIGFLCGELRKKRQKDSSPQTGDIVEIHDEDGALTWPVKAGYVGRRYRNRV